MLDEEKEKKSGTSLKNSKSGLQTKSEGSDNIQNKLKKESISKKSERIIDELVLCNPDDITSLNTPLIANKKNSEITKVHNPDFKNANFVFQINTRGLILSDSQIKEIVSRVKIENEPISLKQQLDEKQNFG